MGNGNLTPREAEALAALKRFVAQKGWAPTVQELGHMLGLRSKSWAYSLLLGLEQKGYICLGKGPRMIRINPEREVARSRAGAPLNGSADPAPDDG